MAGISSTEQVILESQRIILHGLRILLSHSPNQFLIMQDAMNRIDDHLRANGPKETRRG